MVYKRRVKVLLILASAWVLIGLALFNIRLFYGHFKISSQKSSTIYHFHLTNATYAATKEADINNTEEEYLNASFQNVIDFKDLGKNKTKLLLLLIVPAAPTRFDRRQAIRETWWKHCSGRQVKCVFMSDGFTKDRVQRNLTLQERDKYKDMELMPLRGGREFGLRFLHQIKWAMAKFDFQYLLRMDDDYFLCLKRFLSELPLRPKENLFWGFFHCEAGTRWIDEAFMVFTKDVIQKFLAQNESTMLCHPQADQQVMFWLNDMQNITFFHDTRLHHQPPASFIPHFSNISNVCDSYLGVHGAYVKTMRYLGLNPNDNAKVVSSSAIPDFWRFCNNTKFNHHVFNPMWRYEPKLCKDSPSWGFEQKMWFGKEDGEGR